ncbi:hypothetical protein DUI87_06456 [Hirundo rustica rustica]|uniref:Fibronectin type-III domain-containing protein n=1 Tax=Hirundo rustica rustica TaxID=333673 RepID=A0A3M0L0J1_HIRRU|nr:hypothetical protein DUI87_06456 [Hirundo rustica rustica]
MPVDNFLGKGQLSTAAKPWLSDLSQLLTSSQKDCEPPVCIERIVLLQEAFAVCSWSMTGEYEPRHHNIRMLLARSRPQDLLFTSPPKEPVLMCRSNNYPKGFYCSWHLPTPTYIPNSFNISVIHGTKDMVCEKDAIPKNRCHIRYLQLFSTVKYKVTLTVTNALGKNFTTLTFDEFAIVKPDPPESVVAKPVPNNPRRLEVSWQNPSSWPDPESFPLKFFLRYRPLILDQWQHVELSDGTSHTITDAYAGKEYIIQVAAKDNDIGTWSDWSVAVHATPWTEEPKHLTTEAQITETTSASTSSFMAPPTTKICDKGAMVGSGAMAVCWTAGLVVAAYSVLFI